MKKPENSGESWPEIFENLTHIRDKLVEINEKGGHITNYVTMRREVTELGWDGILAKYHPDINVDDPAAWPLFELYRYIKGTMNKRGPV